MSATDLVSATMYGLAHDCWMHARSSALEHSLERLTVALQLHVHVAEKVRIRGVSESVCLYYLVARE